MAQFGEAVAPSVIANIAHDDECYFCAQKQQDDPVGDEDENPDEDADASSLAEIAGMEAGGIAFKNDSSKLGRALETAEDYPNIDGFTVSVDGASFPSGGAAHHLIPGNASLKNSNFFHPRKYLFNQAGAIIYDVNSCANGVWVPGNYSMRGKWSTRSDEFKQAYADDSIDRWSAQFHDAHPDYSSFVIEALNDVFAKVGMMSIVCPKRQGDDEAQNPVYALVGRLNTISARMRRMLEFPERGKWFKNVFTSKYSRQYMKNRSDPVPMDLV